MQVHMLSCGNYKRILTFILFCYANVLNAQVKIKPCEHFIYLDAIKRGMNLESSPDTVTIKEGEVYYLRLLLKSCKGAMYLERHLISNDNIVFSGNYIDAVKLDTVLGWAVDPMTGNRTPHTSTHYRPLRTGVWKYYNDKGELLKVEEYASGKLVASEK